MKEKKTPEDNNFKFINIMGASGSGTTTLGKKLCENLQYKHFDSDDFFWKDKYTEPHPRDFRLNSLKNELDKYDSWILSGAVIDWGKPINSII